MMKVLAVVPCLIAIMVWTVAAEQSEEMKQQVKEMIMGCKEKEGATDADIEQLKSQKLPESHEGLCLIRCMFTAAGVMADGKFTKDGMINALTPLMGQDETKLENMKKLAGTCEKDVGSGDEDPCVAAKMVAECMVKYAPDHGFEIPQPHT